jgi:hypothetical protein
VPFYVDGVVLLATAAWVLLAFGKAAPGNANVTDRLFYRR